MFVSAWDLNSLKFLKKFDTKYNKIASAMIVDLNSLNEAHAKKTYLYQLECHPKKI